MDIRKLSITRFSPLIFASGRVGKGEAGDPGKFNKLLGAERLNMDKENETAEEKEIEQPKTKKETLDQKQNCCNYHNHSAKIILVIIGILIILGGAAAVAKFSIGWHKNEGKFGVRNMMLERDGERGRMMQGGFAREREDRLAQAGISGEITKIDGNNLTIKVSDKEFIATINENTSLSKSGEIAKQSDLKVGDTIRVIGPSKSDGSITANIVIIK